MTSLNRRPHALPIFASRNSITREPIQMAMAKLPAFQHLGRDPLHERVYRQLRDAIIAAKFEPGEKLTVRAISTAFGTSTMPRAGRSRKARRREGGDRYCKWHGCHPHV